MPKARSAARVANVKASTGTGKHLTEHQIERRRVAKLVRQDRPIELPPPDWRPPQDNEGTEDETERA